MKKYKFDSFDELRKWFNKNFSLSLNGKFKGLATAAKVINLDLLLYKLYKVLNGYYRKQFGDVLTFRLNGSIVKLYFR